MVSFQLVRLFIEGENALTFRKVTNCIGSSAMTTTMLRPRPPLTVASIVMAQKAWFTTKLASASQSSRPHPTPVSFLAQNRPAQVNVDMTARIILMAMIAVSV